MVVVVASRSAPFVASCSIFFRPRDSLPCTAGSPVLLRSFFTDSMTRHWALTGMRSLPDRCRLWEQ